MVRHLVRLFQPQEHVKKNWGKVKEYEGIKQVKDDLVYVYCETIEKLKPKVFLLENVSGLAKVTQKCI